MNNELYYKNKYLKYKIKYLFYGGAFKKLNLESFIKDYDKINNKYSHDKFLEFIKKIVKLDWNEENHNIFKLKLNEISKYIYDEYNEYYNYNNDNYDIFNLINIIINNIEKDNENNDIVDIQNLKIFIFLLIIYKKKLTKINDLIYINNYVYNIFKIYLNIDNNYNYIILNFLSILLNI